MAFPTSIRFGARLMCNAMMSEDYPRRNTCDHRQTADVVMFTAKLHIHIEEGVLSLQSSGCIL